MAGGYGAEGRVGGYVETKFMADRELHNNRYTDR